MATVEQSQGGLRVEVLSLRLEIRPIRPADLRPLVPGDAEPLEAVENRLQCLRPVSLGVGVVDAQDHSAVIAAGATSPNPITVTVVVAPAAFPSVTNSATISGGGEPAYNNGNNTVTDPTTVNGADLRIAKSHSGNFTVGVNGTYTLTPSNSGTGATSGTPCTMPPSCAPAASPSTPAPRAGC